jgi:hypothetical protein
MVNPHRVFLPDVRQGILQGAYSTIRYCLRIGFLLYDERHMDHQFFYITLHF